MNGEGGDLRSLLGQCVAHLGEVLGELLLQWLRDELFQIIKTELFDKLDFLTDCNGQDTVIGISDRKNIPGKWMGYFLGRPARLFANSAHRVKGKRNYHGIKCKRSDFNFIQYSCKYFWCLIYY